MTLGCRVCVCTCTRARLIIVDELALLDAKVGLLVRVDPGPGEGWVRRLAVVRQVKESVLRVHLEHRTGPAARGAITVRDPSKQGVKFHPLTRGARDELRAQDKQVSFRSTC